MQKRHFRRMSLIFRLAKANVLLAQWLGRDPVR
jgi:hypothetical protein